jgi:hypothetical protein
MKHVMTWHDLQPDRPWKSRIAEVQHERAMRDRAADLPCRAVGSNRADPRLSGQGWWSRVQDAALYSSHAAAQRALDEATDGVGRVVEVELIVRELHAAPT